MACKAYFSHHFGSSNLKVSHNGVDIATLYQKSTLADVDINETSELHIEAHTTSSSNSDNSSEFLIYCRLYSGKVLTITNADSSW
jgi:hypothetical protein